MTTVNLFSGGLDSYIADAIFQPDINLYIDVHEVYGLKQLDAVQALNLNNVEIVRGPDLSKFIQNDVFLPHRNALFLVIAAMYGNEIYLSSTDGDAFPDKSREFMNRVESMLMESAGHRADRYEILSPFSERTKPEVVRLFKEEGFDMEYLDDTTSCYDSYLHECGKCGSCLRRLVAFAYNDYRVDEIFPLKDEIWKRLRAGTFSYSERENKQAEELLCKLGLYDDVERSVVAASIIRG